MIVYVLKGAKCLHRWEGAVSAMSRWWSRHGALLVVLTALVVSGGPELQSEAAQATPQPQATVQRGAGPVGLSPTILGDMNNDGIVDIRDYGIWRQQFGQTNCGNRADLDGNCMVDIQDYAVWRVSFGQVGAPITPTPTATATPTRTTTSTPSTATATPTTTATPTPSAATHFAVSAPATATAGSAFSFTVTA